MPADPAASEAAGPMSGSVTLPSVPGVSPSMEVTAPSPGIPRGMLNVTFGLCSVPLCVVSIVTLAFWPAATVIVVTSDRSGISASVTSCAAELAAVAAVPAAAAAVPASPAAAFAAVAAAPAAAAALFADDAA